ncbi:MAG: prolyl oligopeptidase family serine peptidase [Muribaculaceae bacterium]|nr:prolyl oligopeptidase family serine peptidase [Muribaculaceae bacterium]
MRKLTLAIAGTLTITTAMTSCKSKSAIEYPVAPTDNTVDTYFDLTVADPYRPLEDDTAAVTKAWVEAENKVTQDYLAQIPYRRKLRDRLETLFNFPRQGLPWKAADGRYYHFYNDGLKNQSILMRSDSIDGEYTPFLDPNTLSDDGTVALTGVSFSNDGKYMAYTISRSGSDWTEIYVMDTATGNLLDDHIEWAKFTSADWNGDGFYYSAYERPGDGKEFSNANENHRIYYHKLGTSQSDDVQAYGDPEHPLHFHSAWVPDSEDYLFVKGGGDGFGESVMFKSLRIPNADWVVMEPSQDLEINIIDIIGKDIYFTTTEGAPRRRLMKAPLDRPTKENWVEVVPEAEGVLTSAELASDKLILVYEKDAANQAFVYGLDGKQICEIELPTFSSVSFSTSKKSDDVFYSAASMCLPTTIYTYDLASNKSETYLTTDINGFNPADYVTEQVFYPSADGTMIPMSLTYKKGLERDGKNPVYLYGYGGFNISLNPAFSSHRVLWLENGGIYAEANLRGGGEYGEEWHHAGTKLNKLNVFNDFIAAAEYLIEQGWTSPEYLSISGGSNGGLLVGATVNMRPELFKVAIPRVGVMDMMRYHLFTIGWNWASDYGRSDDSEEMAHYLYGYSPLHNIKNDGTPYPAIMVTTADHDDRVVPAHSFKYAARLQASDTGDAPKIIRIDSKAGHGAGKPVSKVLDEQADMYSFIFYNLGIEPVVPE